MNNRLNVASFDLSDDEVRLLIGYTLNGVPIVLYQVSKPLHGLIEHGIIKDKEGLIKELSAFHKIEDPVARLNISLEEVCLNLPPAGFHSFMKSGFTMVSAPSGEIGKLDITNVMGQIQKTKIPIENDIVDIIPYRFTLDSGMSFATPPLGKRSKNLAIAAFAHTLPKAIRSDYINSFERAGFRIKRTAVRPYSQGIYFSTVDGLPRTYLLVDIDSTVTYVTLIGESLPYGSGYFAQGRDALATAVSGTLGIDEEEATDLLATSGYDKRELSYAPVLAKGTDPATGEALSIRQKDLNAAVEDFYSLYTQRLQACLTEVAASYKGMPFDAIPMIVTGTGADMPGAQEFLIRQFPARKLYFPHPQVIGAREAMEAANLGMILSGNRYSGALEDNYHGVVNVSRVEQESPKKEKKAKKKATNSSQDDVL